MGQEILAPKGLSKDQILNIWNPDHVRIAAHIAAEGLPIAIGVKGGMGRIYGLCSSWRAFILSPDQGRSIAEIKSSPEVSRDFSIKPPIALTSWPRIKQVVDWSSLTEKELDFETQDAQRILEQVFHQVGGHHILPIKSEFYSFLPFAKKLEDGRKNHAFMCVTRPPLAQLVTTYEDISQKQFFLATSANKTQKEKTYGTWQQVLSLCPDLGTILADDYPNEDIEDTGFSSPMYDFSRFPHKIGVVRLSPDDTHQKMLRFMLQQGLKPDFAFSSLYKILG